ncbi:MAG: MATE family efflux transporter [Myxococcales bacterium]|nr:MATE family efflux transporter [Myxococcales bacterium]
MNATLLRMLLPTFWGLASVLSLSLADTFFVSQLGTDALAVMGYIFPLQLVAISVGVGLGVGTAARVARALGGNKVIDARVSTTHALYLAGTISLLFIFIGNICITPLLILMGVSKTLLASAQSYIIPYYWSAGLLIISMVSNAAMRAFGDVRTPSLLMVLAGVLNAVLDPVLIFGWGPFPRLEIQGAIVATVVARLIVLLLTIYIISARKNMITYSMPAWTELLSSWQRLLKSSLPAIGNRLLFPFSVGILTGMLTSYGDDVVAAFVMGIRIEGLSMIGIRATGTVLIPFLGQNIGAHEQCRVGLGLRFGLLVCFGWGLALTLALGGFATSISGVFCESSPPISNSENKDRCGEVLRLFLLVIPWSYGLKGAAEITNVSLDAFGHPLRSSLLVIMRSLGFMVPAAAIGLSWAGVYGLLLSLSIGNSFAGLFALSLLSYTFYRHPFKQSP